MAFDFTAAMEGLCRDLCARVEELRHIDMSRVAVGYRQTRQRVTHGLQASLTPLRFEDGAEIGRVRGRRSLRAPVPEHPLRRHRRPTGAR